MRLLVLVICAFLAGCAFLGIKDVEKAPTYHKPTFLEESYAIDGRFSTNSKSAHAYGNYTWVKTKEREQINFTTPLGETVAQIIIESGIVTLNAKGKSYVGDDVDDMLYNKVGFDLPLNYLHYWIQGMPIPGEVVDKTLNDGFTQLGWSVEYLEWVNQTHPHIIKCTNQDLVVKLLINWN